MLFFAEIHQATVRRRRLPDPMVRRPLFRGRGDGSYTALPYGASEKAGRVMAYAPRTRTGWRLFPGTIPLMLRTIFRSVAALLLCAVGAIGQDDDGEGPADAFKKRLEDAPIPATADGLDARYEGAVEARRIGDVDRAIDFYRQILKTDPKALSVHVAMGTAYWEKGELTEAEQNQLAEIRKEAEVEYSHGRWSFYCSKLSFILIVQ